MHEDPADTGAALGQNANSVGAADTSPSPRSVPLEEPVTVERLGAVATVRFDRGSRANPLSYETMRRLTAVARGFENDPTLAAVVLTGTSETFSMGMDLKDHETQALRAMPLAERRLKLMTGARMCKAWEEIPTLTISAIEGWCVGGGVALAVATDLRVASDSAQFYVPEIERGMNMSWGSVPRIVNLTGPARAKRLIVLAEKIDAQRAIDWGLADYSSVEGGAVDKAQEVAERAARMPPVALRMCKQDINAYASALAPVAAHSDFDQFALAQSGEDFEEAVSAFLENRTPRFTGG